MTALLLRAAARRTALAARQLGAARVLSTKVTTTTSPHPFESFISGQNGGYVEDMYYQWKDDPSSVHASWRSVFARMDAGALPGQSFVPPPSINAGASLSSAVVPAGGAAMAPISG